MKTHNLLRYFLTAVHLAATLALLPSHAGAEDKPPGYDLEIVKGGIVQKGKNEMLKATLGNVVDTLRNQYTNADIVLSPGLANLKIEDLKLRSGRLWEKLDAIRAASGWKFELEIPRLSTEGLFVLRAAKPTPENERTVEAFNIGPYLQWLRENQDAKQAQENREKEIAERLHELETIVAVTLDGLKQGSSAEISSFQFHRGANLLIVTGTRDAVDVARKVVNALPGQVGLTGGSGQGRDGVFRDPWGNPYIITPFVPGFSEQIQREHGIPRRPVSAPPGAPPAPASPP